MLIKSLKKIFRRDLEKLKQEIEMYKDAQNLWLTEKGIANSAGNLCLHIVGNLNTFIGAEIGKTGYIRNREQEFSLKDVPREELLREVDETIVVVENALDQLTEEQLQEKYPNRVFKNEEMTHEFFLLHLTTHLAYHLGQINYHRRLLDAS